MGIGEWFGFGTQEAPEPAPSRVPTSADLLAAVDRVEAMARAGQVPGGVLSRLIRVTKIVRQTVPRLDRLGAGSAQAYNVMATATDYLPEAISGYLRLPREWADTRPVDRGKTPLLVLVDQLDLLGATMDKVFDAINRADAQALVVHGRFLQEKFGTASTGGVLEVGASSPLPPMPPPAAPGGRSGQPARAGERSRWPGHRPRYPPATPHAPRPTRKAHPMSSLREALDALVAVATTAGQPADRARDEGLTFAAAIAESAPSAAQDWTAARDGKPADLAAANVGFFDAASRGRRWRQSPTALLTELLVTDPASGAAYAKALTEVASAACTLGEPTMRVTGNAAVAAAAQLQAAQVRPAGTLLPGQFGGSSLPGAIPIPPAIDPRSLDLQLPRGTTGGLPVDPSDPPPLPDPASGRHPDGQASDGQADGQTDAATAAEGEPAPEPAKSLEEQLADLDAMIGLGRVKREVHQQVALLRVDKLRREAGLKSPDITRHLVFVGNPGTGKTTVARMVGGIYQALGLLPKGQLVEVDRSELVAGYLGQTAIKTAEVCAKAYGGVLFVDEAYSLSGDQYGQEAINTLVKEMEDHREDLVVIVAGYPDPMVVFIAQNPGLASRFKTTIEFEDYTDDEIVAILEHLATAGDYEVTDEARSRFRTLLAATPRGPAFGNGRFARNLLEEAIGRHAWRLKDAEHPTPEQLRRLLAEDFESADDGYAAAPGAAGQAGEPHADPESTDPPADESTDPPADETPAEPQSTDPADEHGGVPLDAAPDEIAPPDPAAGANRPGQDHPADHSRTGAAE